MLYNKLKIESRKKYLCVYTIIFVIMSWAAFLPWITNNSSFIWEIDGTGQHYPALVYLGQMIRSFIKELINGKVQWRMWDIKRP